MKSFSFSSVLFSLLHLSNLASGFPTADPPHYFPEQKPGDPIIEGSHCTKATVCPQGTFCQSSKYQPANTWCLHPDRLDYIHRPAPFNCRSTEQCQTGKYCRVTNGESGGYCETLSCKCGMGQNLCIPGSVQCELASWGDRGGGCITGKGQFSNCRWPQDFAENAIKEYFSMSAATL